MLCFLIVVLKISLLKLFTLTEAVNLIYHKALKKMHLTYLKIQYKIK